MSFPTLNIGDLCAKMPIIQGGMGVGISLSRLASAVAKEGGIGVIAGAMIGMKEPDIAQNPIEANKRALSAELRKARDEAQELLIVKANVDRILQNTERGGNAQEKGTVSFAANCALY